MRGNDDNTKETTNKIINKFTKTLDNKSPKDCSPKRGEPWEGRRAYGRERGTRRGGEEANRGGKEGKGRYDGSIGTARLKGS